MRLSKRTKITALSTGALVVVVVLLKLVLHLLYPTDLRSQLAHVLGVSPEVLWINLPPAKGRLPGASFIYESTLLAVDDVQTDSNDIQAGNEFDLDWVTSTGSRLNATADAGFLGLVYGDSGNLKVSMKATKCRSLEVPLDKLKQRLLNSSEIKEQAAQGRKPLIIVRSYEGLVTLRIKKGDSTSAGYWQQVKKSAKANSDLPNSKVAVQAEQEDSLEIAFGEPMVFAYEMVEVKLIATHLGSDPNDVVLTPVPEPKTAAQPQRPSSTAQADDPRRWALATVAVGEFPKTAWLQQDWNQYSADAVARGLSRFAPTFTASYRSSPENPASADSILNFAATLGRRARGSGARLIVFYYVGHTVTSATGQVYLLQSGVTPRALRGLTSGQSPPQIANLGEILHVMEAASPTDPQVALRLSDLHATLSQTGIPFVILLDGCMGNDNLKQSVEGAGFRFDPEHPTLYYVGAEPLTLRLISQVGSSLRDFGQAWPYLHDTNPIVFSAKPGTLAMLGDDPGWQMAPPLAPLARKVRRLLSPEISGEPSSLSELILRTVDLQQGVGEIEMEGSISWSDFSTIKEAAHDLVPVDKRIPFADASRAVVASHDPGVGPIEGFYYSESRKSFYLVSQGTDWRIWKWNRDTGKQMIAGDLRFPVLAGTADGRVFIHHDDGKTLAEIDVSGHLNVVRTDLYIQRMAPGWAPSELLVVGEASTVDELAPVWSIKEGKFSEIDHLQSSYVISVASLSPAGFAYTREDTDGIHRRSSGQSGSLAAGLVRPGQLTRYGETLYCMARSKARLYRLHRGEIMQADLLKGDGRPLLESSDQEDGFQETKSGTVLATSASIIVELQPEKLLWVPVQINQETRP